MADRQGYRRWHCTLGILAFILSASIIGACDSEPPTTPTLGASRDAVQTVFEDEMGFEFESIGGDTYYGIVGYGADGAVLELTGSVYHLTQADLRVDADGVVSGHAVGAFLTTLLPEWTGGIDWFFDNLNNAQAETQRTTVDDAEVILFASGSHISLKVAALK